MKRKKKYFEGMKCPKCNGKLIKMKGQYCSFYGCWNFPKCDYKIKPK